MLRRLRDVLQREYTDQSLNRQFRPNELRQDVVRAERLRREAQRVEPAASRPARALEELRERSPQGPLPAPAARSPQIPQQIAALKTRSGLRQAWLLKEILSPPLALRGPFSNDDR